MRTNKLIYLIVLILVLGLIVAGCTTSVVPPAEQSGLNDQTKTVTAEITVILKDSQGVFVDGGIVCLGVGGWPQQGLTGEDSPGTLTFPYTGAAMMCVRVTAPNNGGTLTTPLQDITVNSTFKLNTERVEIKLIDHNGDPLNGGKVSIGHGGWPEIGITGANGPGTLYHEYFPGIQNFRMSYNYGTEQKSHVHAEGVVLVFQTGLVDLQFSGTIQHQVGGWPSYVGPKEMLPVPHSFGFSDPGYSRKLLTFTPTAGVKLTKSIFYIRLRNSSSAGVEGGAAALGVGGWPSIGSTDSTGVLLYAHDGKVGNMRVRMTAPDYGGTQTSLTQNHATNSFYDFQTTKAIIQLKNSVGTLTDGGVVRAGFGGWPVIGTTGDNGDGTLHHEMFPGTYNFRMTYNDTTETKGQDIATPVVFQTKLAVIKLEDHNGNPLSGGVVQFGVGGWPVIGTTEATLGQVTRELLPGTYNFRMSYNYGTEEKNQDIKDPVVFRTGLVSLHFSGTIQHGVGGWPVYSNPCEMLPVEHRFGFSGPGHPRTEMRFTPTAGGVLEKTVAYIRLLNSDGTPQTNYTADWYRYGAPPYAPVEGNPDTNGVLLNAMDGYNNTYYAYHRVKYLNAQSYPPGLAQVPASNSFYDFQLTKVEVQLKDHIGNLMIGTGPEVYVYTYYSGVGGEMLFGTLNNGTVSKDLLQGYRHYFTIKDYNGTKQMIWQDDLTNPVVFQTFLVLDNGWGCTNYYQYGWPSYGQTFPGTGQVELLPGLRTYYKNNVAATKWFDVLTGGKTLDLSTGLVTP